MIKLIITENQGGQRLDRFLKKYFDKAPLSHIYKMIRKDVKVNGKRSSAEAMLKEGDELTIYIGEEDAQALTDEISGMVGDKDVERQYGGQPLYYYLISAE